MQLADLLFVAVMGAVAGVLVGYFVFAHPGELGSATFPVWLDHNLHGPAGLWALGGAVVGFGGRYLMVTRDS